jgi:hypothetical protein
MTPVAHLNMLREMGAKLNEVFTKVEAVETRVRHVESQLDDLRTAVTHALGWSGAGTAAE